MTLPAPPAAAYAIVVIVITVTAKLVADIVDNNITTVRVVNDDTV